MTGKVTDAQSRMLAEAHSLREEGRRIDQGAFDADVAAGRVVYERGASYLSTAESRPHQPRP